MDETCQIAQSIMNITTADGHPLIFNARIEMDGKKNVFPADRSALTEPEEQFIFDISSEIPDAYKAAAAKSGLELKPGSHGCIFQADGVQLIQLIDFGSSKGLGDFKQ